MTKQAISPDCIHHRFLNVGIVSCVCGLLGPVAICLGQDAKPTDDLAQTFFAKHCQACHEGAEPKGDIELKSLSRDFSDQASREKWLLVLEQIKEGTMPPNEKPRPPGDAVKAITDWITSQVANAEAQENASEGRVVLRRLNRNEYENTVRDLLGVDIELERPAAAGSSTNGFDNSAEALHVSSFLLEQYLEAADKVLDAAIVNGPRPEMQKRRSTSRTRRPSSPRAASTATWTMPSRSSVRGCRPTSR